MKNYFTPKDLTLFVLMIFVVASLFAALPSTFLTEANLQSMASQVPEFGLLAMGMMLTMITGGIDLSIVAVANLAGVVAAMILTSHLMLSILSVDGAILVAVFAVVLLSLICGIFNGLLISLAGVPAILATLGSQGVFLGFAIILTQGHSISGLPDAFSFVGNGDVLGVPVSFILFVTVVAVVYVLLNWTRYGFTIFMVGTNPTASMYSGIAVKKVIIKTYALSALLAGLASLVMISRANSMRPGYGESYLLQAVLVVVLGGTDPNGGSGKLSGLIMAIIILQTIQSGLNMLSLSPFFKTFMWGLALLLAMTANFLVSAHNARKRIRQGVRI